MSSRWRRFEVLLPLQFNDGRDVPAEWLADAVLEIVEQFGAASYEPQQIEDALATRRSCLSRQPGPSRHRRSGYAEKPPVDEGIQAAVEEEARATGIVDGQLSRDHRMTAILPTLYSRCYPPAQASSSVFIV